MLCAVAAASALLAAQWVSPVRGADRPDPVDALEHSALSKCSSDIFIKILENLAFSEIKDYFSLSQTCRLMNEFAAQINRPTFQVTATEDSIGDLMERFSKQQLNVAIQMGEQTVNVRGYHDCLLHPFTGNARIQKIIKCPRFTMFYDQQCSLPTMNDWVICQENCITRPLAINIRSEDKIWLPKCNSAYFLSPSKIVTLVDRSVFQLYDFNDDAEPSIEKVSELNVKDYIQDFYDFSCHWKPRRDFEQQCQCSVIVVFKRSHVEQFFEIDFNNQVVNNHQWRSEDDGFNSVCSDLSEDGSTVVCWRLNSTKHPDLTKVTVIDTHQACIKREFFTPDIIFNCVISPDNSMAVTCDGKRMLDLNSGETTQLLTSMPNDLGSAHWLNDQVFAGFKSIRCVQSCKCDIDCGEPDFEFRADKHLEVGSLVELGKLHTQGTVVGQNCWFFPREQRLIVAELETDY